MMEAYIMSLDEEVDRGLKYLKVYHDAVIKCVCMTNIGLQQILLSERMDARRTLATAMVVVRL